MVIDALNNMTLVVFDMQRNWERHDVQLKLHSYVGVRVETGLAIFEPPSM
jgi:hypothetical protein